MRVAVKTRDELVSEIRYLPSTSPLIGPRNSLAERAALQLERYLADPDASFDLPLLIEGTPFQRRLWDALREIPRGRTLTYGALAKRLEAEPRAVGGDRVPRQPVLEPQRVAERVEETGVALVQGSSSKASAARSCARSQRFASTR